MAGKNNPLEKRLLKEPCVKALGRDELVEVLTPSTYIGDAVDRCEKFVNLTIVPILSRYGAKHRGTSSK